MAERTQTRWSSLFQKVSKDLEERFYVDCAQKNNFRFTILPLFNIVTQVSCYFIYLYIYPATFPDKPMLDPVVFSAFSAFYILVNVAFFLLFNRLRRRNDPARAHASYRLVMAFMVLYIVCESIEAIMEVEISGNIYRFLATFFVASFLPLLKRRDKFAIITAFAALVEVGFAYITAFQGYNSNNRFQEIVVLFYVACIVIANITYNSTVKTFTLRQELVAANESLSEANLKLEQLAVVDPLTGVSNRRAFDQYMTLAWRSGFNEEKPVAVIMIDIDDFKRYNDAYGHLMGDECLRTVASCISGFFQRESDMVARYGGEEFIVLMANAGAENAFQAAEAVRKSVESLRIENKESRACEFVTISVGVAAAVPALDLRYEDLIKMADDALYEAKASGRNRTCLAQGIASDALDYALSGLVSDQAYS